MAPKPCAFWPLTISAGVNDTIDLLVGATPYTATIVAGTYYSPTELFLAVLAALNAAVANGWTASISATGRGTVSGSSAFSLRFSTGANAAASPRHVLGFGAVDTASATSATGQYQIQNAWYADRAVREDEGDKAERTGAVSIALDGSVQAVTFGSVRKRRDVLLTNLPPAKTRIEKEGASLNEAIERLWQDGAARFRWWPDASAPSTFADYALDEKALTEFAPDRLYAGKELYGYTLKMRRLP